MLRKFEWALLSVLVLIVLMVTANWVMRASIHFRKSIPVPDLTNKSIVEAMDILSSYDLGVRKEGSEFSENVPAGTVLRQMPPGGTPVRTGKIIRVVLSQGNESVYVPDLTSQPLRAAEISLRSNFLSLGEVQTRPSVAFVKDAVVAQNPPPRKIVPRNTFVQLIVSAGPPEDGTILVPNFIGRTVDAAKDWSRGTGIKVEVSENRPSPAMEPGMVLAQDILPDAPVDKNGTVRLVLSSKEGVAPQEANPSRLFRFEVPQSESLKGYVFIAVDNAGTHEVWRGRPQPGTKLSIPIPDNVSASALIRILVNGIITDERNLQ
jgi:serine/threonine-protein kinase